MKEIFLTVNEIQFTLYLDIEDIFHTTGIIESETSTAGEVAEATVTHVLLAFHMLFINILILNLLIAVFK